MNFDLGEDQAMLKETLTRLLADHYSFETRRALTRTERGWSPELWAQLAELGVLAATFPEANGGLGGGAEETLVIAEALGSVLSAEPYLPTVVMAGAALRLGDNAVARAELLPVVAAGEAILACALDDDAVTARRHGDRWVLNGAATNVICGGAADQFIVLAGADQGSILVVVDARAEGLTVRSHRSFDGLNAVTVTFEDVEAGALLAQGAAAEALTERMIQHAIACLAAEAVGLMQSLLDATVEHLKTRQQFGQALGKFQALQHRAVEMLVWIEQARSMAIYAAMMTDDPDTIERRKAFAAIKTVVSNAARFVGQNAVQLHGGIGMTEEHRAGWGLRRLAMIEMLYGDGDAQAARLAELGGLVEPA
jgi:alkylation response protein AidB-like acyl-CoA dehydrogenase